MRQTTVIGLALLSAACSSAAPSQRFITFPSRAQDAEQQSQDAAECEATAAARSGERLTVCYGFKNL
jgi:hypothetical protein